MTAVPSSFTSGYSGSDPHPAAVTREGKTLAPGVVLSFTGTFNERGMVLDGELVRAYFDSGLYHPGTDDPQYVALGYVLCPVRNGVVQDASAIDASIDTFDGILRQGGLRLERLTPEERGHIASSRVARGNELWDLVAAYRALTRLREVRYHGKVQAMTDNDSVIRFLKGPKARLTLLVGDAEIGPDIRTEIWATAQAVGEVEWIWVPREKNLADPLIREKLDAHIRGFRQGRTVQEISDRRLERLGRPPESGA